MSMDQSEIHRAHILNYLKRHKEVGSVSISSDNYRPIKTMEADMNSNLELQTALRTEKIHENISKKTPVTKTNPNRQSAVTQQGLTKRKVLPRITGKVNIYHLPDEILLKIFHLLDPHALLQAACVCRQWQVLAKDNLLWQGLFQKYAQGATASLAESCTKPPLDFWRDQCLQQCSKKRNKRAFKNLKKLSSFTGLPQLTDQALQQAGIYFHLELVTGRGHSEVPITLLSQDVFWHKMAACVRWYSLDRIPLSDVNKICISACAPLFFNKDGSTVNGSPFQRSLLMEVDVTLSSWLKQHTTLVSDDMLNVYRLPGDLLLATWKADGAVSFFCLGLHYHHLVYRCLQGTSTRQCPPVIHRVIADDIDSQYGLHNYSCTLEIRGMRQSLWSQQYINLHCSRQAVCGGFAELILIRRDNPVDHVVFSKPFSMTWKTELFKGVIKGLVFLDCTLLDERAEVFWKKSVPLSATFITDLDPLTASFDYNYENETVQTVHYTEDPRVHIHIEIGQTLEGKSFIISLNLQIKTTAINEWFGTSY